MSATKPEATEKAAETPPAETFPAFAAKEHQVIRYADAVGTSHELVATKGRGGSWSIQPESKVDMAACIRHGLSPIGAPEPAVAEAQPEAAPAASTEEKED